MKLQELKELKQKILELTGCISTLNENNIALEMALNILDDVELQIAVYEPVITKLRCENNLGQQYWFAEFNNSGEYLSLFKHYPDEWAIYKEELLGKTREEAVKLARARDIAYIQS